MRKQYHFRQKGEDTYIWDVHKLVELSQNLTVKEVNLSEIKELNEAYWYPNQQPTTQDLIDHFILIQEADLSYPIILCSEGRIMDGMHRVAKAKMLGHETIKVLQFAVDPEPDFINVHEDDLEYND